MIGGATAMEPTWRLKTERPLWRSVFVCAALLGTGCTRGPQETGDRPRPNPALLRQPASAATTAQQRTAPPAPINPKSGPADALLHAENFDLAATILALAEEDAAMGGADAAATLAEIDELAAQVKADLPAAPDGTDYFDSLYLIVMKRRAAEPWREDRPDDYSLKHTLKHRRGSCLSAGILILAVARRTGAPIYGVQCPGHLFLKYVPTPSAKAQKAIALNFDPTRPMPDRWYVLDDDFYRKWRRFDESAEKQGVYLTPLTDQQVVSCYLASRSGYYAARGQFAEALRDANRALALNEKNITAHLNAGVAQEAAGNSGQALTHYTTATKLDPESVKALNNLAWLRVRAPSSEFFAPKDAERLIERALRLAPNAAYVHATSAEVYAAQQDWRGATRAMMTAMKLDPKNASYRERFLQLRAHLRSED